LQTAWQAFLLTTSLSDILQVGRSDRIWNRDMNHHFTNTRVLNMEVTVPLSLAREALKALREYFMRADCPVNPSFPIGLRANKTDGFWLSPCYVESPEALQKTMGDLLADGKGRGDSNFPVEPRVARAEEGKVFWIDFFWPIYAKDSKTDSAPTVFFDEMLRVLAPFHPRPHWGKNVSHDDADGSKRLRPLYPKWDEFIALRAKMDPENKFLNQHFAHYLGIDVPGASAPNPYHNARTFWEMQSGVSSTLSHMFLPCLHLKEPPFTLNAEQIEEIAGPVKRKPSSGDHEKSPLLA
jgi:hypothetical protein